MKRRFTQTEMLSSAEQVILNYGYHNTNVRQVMESVGLGKGSFSNYFDSKEDMGLQVLESFMKKLQDWQQKSLANMELGPVERIRNYFAELACFFKEVTHFKGGCMVGNFSLELSSNSEVFRSRLNRFFLEVNTAFAACLREGQQKGEIRDTMDAEDLAELVMIAWEGAVLRMKTMKNEYALDLFLNDFLGLIKSEK